MNTFTAAMAAMTPAKLKELRARIGDEQVDAFLASLDGMQQKAMAAGISYKGATMTRTHTTTVAAEADAFETSLKGIPPQLHDGLWDYWARYPALAIGVVARLKAPLAPPRLKAAPGSVTHALALMEKLADRMDGQAFDLLMKPIVQHLEDATRMMDQGVTTASHAAAATGKTTKTPKMIPFEQLLVGNAAGQAADARAIDALYAARLRGK